MFNSVSKDSVTGRVFHGTLMIVMGEFRRTPKIGTPGCTDSRDHWHAVMSMALAGGGLRHGRR